MSEKGLPARGSTGSVVSIFITSDKGLPMQEVDRIEVIGGQGLAGDRYALGRGAYSKQKPPKIRHVSLIAEEAIADANASAGTDFAPIETRRNIVTRGVDLNALVGREFRVGDIRVRGLEPCLPCARPSRLSHKRGFLPAFQDRGGLRAAILDDGEIVRGATIMVPAETT